MARLEIMRSKIDVNILETMEAKDLYDVNTLYGCQQKSGHKTCGNGS